MSDARPSEGVRHSGAQRDGSEYKTLPIAPLKVSRWTYFWRTLH